MPEMTQNFAQKLLKQDISWSRDQNGRSHFDENITNFKCPKCPIIQSSLKKKAQKNPPKLKFLTQRKLYMYIVERKIARFGHFRSHSSHKTGMKMRTSSGQGGIQTKRVVLLATS